MAKRVTINKINKAIAQFGYGIWRGEGYFYFYCLDHAPDDQYLDASSVYTMQLGHWDLAWWVDELLGKIEDTEIGKLSSDQFERIKVDCKISILDD